MRQKPIQLHTLLKNQQQQQAVLKIKYWFKQEVQKALHLTLTILVMILQLKQLMIKQAYQQNLYRTLKQPKHIRLVKTHQVQEIRLLLQ